MSAFGWENSPLRLIHLAIQFNAPKCVDSVPHKAQIFLGDELDRAVKSVGTDVVRLLLSVSQFDWTIDKSTIVDLFAKQLSEPVLATVGALAEKPSLFQSLDFPPDEPLLPLRRTFGQVAEEETRLRRRALSVLRRIPGLVSRTDSQAAFLPALCRLGYEVPICDLLASLTDMQDARLLVIRCVEAAAAAGEVAIVGHLLTNTFPALDTLALVAAAESALTLAASFIRLDVARAVLEGPAAARLPAEDIAFIVRSIHGSDNFIAHAAPELFRYLALTLTRLSQDA